MPTSKTTRTICAVAPAFALTMLCSTADAALRGRGAPEPLILDEYRTLTTVTTARCPSYCTDVEFGQSDGGKGQTLAQSDFSHFRGTAKAYAELSGGFQTPILKAAGTGLARGYGNNRGTARALGVQGYTYNGPDTQLSLDVRLTGDLYDPGQSSWSQLAATVLLFDARGFEFSSDVGTILYESSSRLKSQVDDSKARADLFQLDTGNADKTATITVNASAGDSFYIWASLLATGMSSGSQNGVADAYHTLTTTFTDSFGNAPVGLVSATPGLQGPAPGGAVPVSAPATLALALPGLLGLGFTRRANAA